MLREAEVYVTNVERLVADRKRWKKRVEGKMYHLYKRECQKGKQYKWGKNEERMEKIVRVLERLVCTYDGCGKVCKSKARLKMHEKRMHGVAKERVRFACSICGMNVETEGARKNHERSCTGGEIEADEKSEFGRCDTWITKGNYARHVRLCAKGNGERNARGARGRVINMKGC